MHSTHSSYFAVLGRLLVVSLIVGFPAIAAHGDSCSCSSPYCSTSISCSGACYAICGSTCTSGCSGGQGGGGFTRSPGGDPGDNLEWTGDAFSIEAPLTIDLLQAGASDVSAELSRELGAKVNFITEEPVTLDIKGVPSVEVLRQLGRHGVVFIYRGLEERSEERRKGLTTVFAKGAFPDRISQFLTQLLERPVQFLPDGDEPLSIEAKDVPVYQLLEALGAHGALKYD